MLSYHRITSYAFSIILLLSPSWSLASSPTYCHRDGHGNFGASSMAFSGDHVFITHGDFIGAITSCRVNGKKLSNCIDASASIAQQFDIKIEANQAYISAGCKKYLTVCDVANEQLSNCTRVSSKLFVSPYGMSIANNFVYVANHNLDDFNPVTACELDGKGLTNCANTKANLHHPYYLAMLDQKVYLTNNNATVSSCDAINNQLQNCKIVLRGKPVPDKGANQLKDQKPSDYDNYYSIAYLNKQLIISNTTKDKLMSCSIDGGNLNCSDIVISPSDKKKFPQGDIRTVIIHNSELLLGQCGKWNSFKPCSIL